MKSIEDIRHIGMKVLVTLLWVNAALIAVRAIFVAHPQMIVLIAGGLTMALLGTFTWRADKAGVVARTTAGLTQAAQVALLVGAFSGSDLQIDMHMYFFAMLAICAACIDWRPILAFTGLTAVHHVVLYFVIPAAVFPGESSVLRVGLHAVILVAEAGVLLALTNMMWRSFASTQLAISEAQAAQKEAEEQTKIAGDAQDANTQAQSQREAERTEENAKLQNVIETLANGLTKLSNGDLTANIPSPFEGKLDQLRTDFNGSVAKLAKTMCEMNSVSTNLRENSVEISNATNELSQRTETQAASLEETSAALDEITATVRETSERANEAAVSASNARADSEKSSKVVISAVAAMEGIEKASGDISNIINVIDEIAFQTNLLALNAGVEAARAGEAGKGFAVVAQEVRELAQRSASAAKEIKELITKSGDEVANGVQLVQQTGEVLEKISTHVATIDSQIGTISQGAAEQLTGIQEVNSAVNSMDQVTQRNAAMVEENTAVTQHIADEVAVLAELIQTFDIGNGVAAKQANVPSSGPVAQATPVMPASATDEHDPKPSPAKAMVKKVANAFNGNSAVAVEETDGWDEF